MPCSSRFILLVFLFAAALCWPERLTPSVIPVAVRTAADTACFVSCSREGCNWNGRAYESDSAGLLDDDNDDDDDGDDDEGTDGFWQDITAAPPSAGLRGDLPKKLLSSLRGAGSPISRPPFLRFCLFLC